MKFYNYLQPIFTNIALFGNPMAYPGYVEQCLQKKELIFVVER